MIKGVLGSPGIFPNQGILGFLVYSLIKRVLGSLGIFLD